MKPTSGLDQKWGDYKMTPLLVEQIRTYYRQVAETTETPSNAVVLRTPGGTATRAVVIAERPIPIHDLRDLGQYEITPHTYEEVTSRWLREKAPQTIRSLQAAKLSRSILIEVEGLVPNSIQPNTPLDGVVDEREVKAHLVALTGAFTENLNLVGFAYSGENYGRLLRAVAPVQRLSTQASSQGFANDLGWHQDNADRTLPGCESILKDQGPMNSFQAFAVVTPSPIVPMEILALDDLIAEIIYECGEEVIAQLEKPQFTIRGPDSHEGRSVVVNAPILVRDKQGNYHGRFHSNNITSSSLPGQWAIEQFYRISHSSKCIMEVQSKPGSLIIYSNTRVLHRRRKYTPRLDRRDRYYIRLYLTDRRIIRLYQGHRVLS